MELLEGLETGQHPSKREGGHSRDDADRPQPGDRA